MMVAVNRSDNTNGNGNWRNSGISPLAIRAATALEKIIINCIEVSSKSILLRLEIRSFSKFFQSSSAQNFCFDASQMDLHAACALVTPG